MDGWIYHNSVIYKTKESATEYIDLTVLLVWEYGMSLSTGL